MKKDEEIIGDLWVKECWDGTAIAIYEKRAGKWIVTGLKCPPKP